MNHVVQRSITPETDLREMLRAHIIGRSLACMEAAAARRTQAMVSPAAMATYRQAVRTAVRGFYGKLPAGTNVPPPTVTSISAFTHPGFRIENVLFDSFPGWQVNATVYVPTGFQPPFPAVIVPVGHSGKQFESYQLPCQYFARSGFLAVCFDPPGQASEKKPGNDHFNDGVRDYLLGETSSRYFIADALRCIDYLATRSDADLSRGVAMTGVSGGGTTTTFAALLDDRITVIGPSCCVTPLADLDITQCYAGCPETHPFGRYAAGIDEVDLLCAAAPTPCLLMAGEKDEVFHIGATRRLAELVARGFAAAGVAERFGFFVDSGGHAYSLAQAREFSRFMNRWLRSEPNRAVPDLPDDSFGMLPHVELRCSPRADVNMRTRALVEADALAAGWDRAPEAVLRAAAEIVGLESPVSRPTAEVGEPFRVWSHDWRSVMLRPEPGIELPGTLLTARRRGAAATILHIDDRGRHRLLHRGGWLTAALRFFHAGGSACHLFFVDLRGWGDTTPAMYPYEMAGWGSVDRYVAYATAALGDPILAMRMRDALAALAWLRSRPEVDPEQIILMGAGLGGVVALHVAACDRGVAGVIAWDGLSSFRSLLAAEHYPWPADTFLPQVLRHYDLPELVAALSCPVRLFALRNGAGETAAAEELCAYRELDHVSVLTDGGPPAIAKSVAELMAQNETFTSKAKA